MFKFLKRKNTTDLEEHYKEQAYLKEKIRLAEQHGKTQAEAEAKEKTTDQKKKTKKVKSIFQSFQDYADDFANQPSVMKELNFGGSNGRKKKRKKNTISRSRYGF